MDIIKVENIPTEGIKLDYSVLCHLDSHIFSDNTEKINIIELLDALEPAANDVELILLPPELNDQGELKTHPKCFLRWGSHQSDSFTFGYGDDIDRLAGVIRFFLSCMGEYIH